MDFRQISEMCSGLVRSTKQKGKRLRFRFGDVPKIEAWQFTTKKSKPIGKFDPINGALLETYASATEAERLGVGSQPSIFAALTGKQKTSSGYVWKYLTQENEDV